MPVGLSFFTFQAIGYLVDIQRGAYEPEKSLPLMGLFLSFFPQLLAGPIERFAQLAPQLRKMERPTPDMVLSGLVLLLYGVFLKLAVGEMFAVNVDEIYAHYATWARARRSWGPPGSRCSSSRTSGATASSPWARPCSSACA